MAINASNTIKYIFKAEKKKIMIWFNNLLDRHFHSKSMKPLFKITIIRNPVNTQVYFWISNDHNVDLT